MEEQKQEVGNQSLLIACQLELEIKKNQLENPGVFKTTSKNMAKWWKMRQKTQATTRAGKLAEAVIKQIATQKLQTEKKIMRK